MWLIALLPAIIASIWIFRSNSLRIIASCVAISVVLEMIVNYFYISKDIASNWSSVTLGVLLALMLPYNAPWWIILSGCFIMIIIGKKLFGGLGAYPVHPAVLSFAIMLISWPDRFDYTASLISVEFGNLMIEPIRLVKTLGASAESTFDWQSLLLGYQVAGIGNALVVFLLGGGLFLIIARQITWHIPLSFLVGTFFMALTLHMIEPTQFATPVFHILAGSTIFGAFFLATDYTTSPANPIPMLLYGFLGGVLMVLIRSFSNYTNGVVFAILLINLCYPLLDRITPKVYGLEEARNA